MDNATKALLLNKIGSHYIVYPRVILFYQERRLSM